MASSTKHFFQDPTRLVHAALQASALANPHTELDQGGQIISVRADARPAQQRVAVLGGGGCGHEPSFAGLVGPGLLTAAVSGTIFASPNAKQIFRAISAELAVQRHRQQQQQQDGGGGVLVIVMNYTGDVLNFGLAVERIRASSDAGPGGKGVHPATAVEMVVVGDDVGVPRSGSSKIGRRGIAGTVLVHKISGALAARGYSLACVAHAARVTAANLVSVGARLQRVHIPGHPVGGPGPDLAADTDIGAVEIGVGIHNEGGSSTVPTGDISHVVRQMLAQLLDPNDRQRAWLPLARGCEVVLVVNNLGGVSPLELAGVVHETTETLRETYGIAPVRVMSGTYMSSLNALGFSISLLRVVPLHLESGLGMVDLLDDLCYTTSWIPTIPQDVAVGATLHPPMQGPESPAPTPPELCKSQSDLVRLRYAPVHAQAALVAALERIIAEEPVITRLDTVVGDGDCGTGMSRGAQAILSRLSIKPLTGDAATDLAAITSVVEETMDGTSGAIYAIFLHALTGALHGMMAMGSSDHGGQQQQRAMTHQDWAAALREARSALDRYTPARVGDRTLIDALHPFIDVLGSSSGSPGHVVEAAAAAARAGAEATKGMQASLGRTVYVSGDGFKQVPDPGAWGLACFLETLAAVIQTGSDVVSYDTLVR